MTIQRVVLFAPQGRQPGGVARRLMERCQDHPVAERWWLTTVDDPQLRIEHALDLNHSDLALFLVDGEGTGDAWEFRAIELDTGQPMPSSEADVTPADVLRSLATLGRRADLPRCYLLSVRDSDDDAAFALLLSLLEEPTVAYWDTRLS